MSPAGPRGPVRNQQLPPGAVRVGNTVGYPGTDGYIRPTPGEAINSNQGRESDMGRGSSGGCDQNSDSVPNQPWRR